MTRPSPMRQWRAYPVAGAMILFGAAPVMAQGTSAEREACTPDALRLCQDAIPDIPKTTACMKAHQAELSPRCRTFVVGRAEPTRRERRPSVARRIERDEPPAEGRGFEREAPPDYARGFEREVPPPDEDDAYPGDRRYLYRSPDGREAEAPEFRDRDRARDEIGRLCEEDMIDPRTCAVTDRALR